ncbi:MAG: transcriptional regulator [Acidobacteriota bacterium]
MSTTTIDLDTKRYRRLLARALPTVIKSEDQNSRMLAIVEDLMAKGEDSLTPEEDALLELLVDLVHDFEERRYPLPPSPPHKMLAFLLEQRELKLAAFFRVGVELFL